MALYDNIAVKFFLEEADEHLCTLEEGLLRLERNPEQAPQLVESLFRSAHTLKGSAGLAKLTTISSLAHCLEDAFEGVRDESIIPSSAIIDAMLFSLDHIKNVVNCTATGDPEPESALGQVEERLQRAMDQTKAEKRDVQTVQPLPAPEAASKTEPAEPPSLIRRDNPGSRTIRVDGGQIEKVMNVLGELTVTKSHLVDQLRFMETLREEIVFSGERLLKEVGRFSEKYLYALPKQTKSKDNLVSDFDDLEFDRYDEVNLFARKLQEISNDINEGLRATSDFFARFSTDMDSVDRMTNEMKERFSEIRTIHAGALFQRFSRSVRELAKQRGRPLELCTSGEETPIDRTIYDALFDPILHIIRNAVAHGLEDEEERSRLGKPAAGQITLAAIRRGNTVEVTVSDDGRGIRFDRIRERAMQQGLLPQNSQPSKEQLLNLIFQPGFSTAESTDTHSGRGVGMNVVMDRLAAINGTIDVDTKEGVGTTFRLTLPLSLVIINVVQFRLGDQAFVIPSTLVSEITDLPDGISPGQEKLEIRGSEISLVRLRKLLSQPPNPQGSDRFAIITQSSGVSVAIVVDEILSQEDTVIKPFGSMLHNLPLFSGTSIAGDGRLRLVVNPARLLNLATGADQPAKAVHPAAVTEVENKNNVLVVDDSLSVRRYAEMMLENGGFNVLTATNGLEALEILEQKKVHFIFSDLEMPLMHGYELLSELGRRGLLETIPVAILSSRAGENHVSKAKQLGACDYLVKPFEEETLLQVVRRHTG